MASACQMDTSQRNWTVDGGHGASGHPAAGYVVQECRTRTETVSVPRTWVTPIDVFMWFKLCVSFTSLIVLIISLSSVPKAHDLNMFLVKLIVMMFLTLFQSLHILLLLVSGTLLPFHMKNKRKLRLYQHICSVSVFINWFYLKLLYLECITCMFT